MDPGTAIGVVSLGLQVCGGLLKFYGDWQAYYEDVAVAYGTIQGLEQVLTGLQHHLATHNAGDPVVDRVLSCRQGLQLLEVRLKKIQTYGAPQGWRQKSKAALERAGYPFQAKTLKKLSTQVTELQNTLALAVGVSVHEQVGDSLEVTKAIKLVVDDTHVQTTTISAVASDARALLVGQQHLLSDQSSRINDIKGDITTTLHLAIASEHESHLQSQQLAVIASASTAIQQLSLSEHDRTDHERLLAWLAAPEPYSNHNACRDKTPGTGGWLFRSDPYLEWEGAATGFLWLHGAPGSGKTYLTATVIDKLKQDATTLVLFFYFTFSDKSKQDTYACLSSLVAQIPASLSYTLLKALAEACDNSAPTIEQLLSLIKDVSTAKPLTLVLDALDEVPSVRRGELLDCLTTLHKSGLKIFCSSRPLSDLTEGMKPACSLSLESRQADADIRQYIDTELASWPPRPMLSDSAKSEVRKVLTDKAHGSFRWTFCQIDRLKKLASTRPKYITAALAQLPETLDATYERMVLDLDPICQEEAIKALRWVALASQPLTIDELSEAILINLDDSKDSVDFGNRCDPFELIDMLSGLIVCESSTSRSRLTSGLSEVVRLAHFSVQEWLLSSRIRTSRCSSFALDANADAHLLGQSCIAYVLETFANIPSTTGGTADVAADDVQDMDVVMPFSFFAYAVSFSPQMVSISGQPRLQEYLIADETSRRKMRSFQRAYNLDSTFEHSSDTAVQCALDLGDSDLLLRLLAAGHSPERPSPRSWAPVRRTAETGQDGALIALLKAGADPMVHFPPWQGAVVQESWTVSRSLWTDVEIGYDCPLARCAKDTLESTLAILLPHSSAEAKTTALLAAVAADQYKSVKVLVQNGVNATSILSEATRVGTIPCLDLVLQCDMDVNQKQVSKLEYAIDAAANKGEASIFTALIEKGARPTGQTLHHAIRMRSEEMCIHLMKFDMSPAGLDDLLMAAAGQGWAMALHDLLANHSFPRHELDQALQRAYGSGSQAAVNVLASRGAAIVPNKALHALAQARYIEPLRAALQTGVDVNTVDCNPLLSAIAAGSTPAIYLLLQYGARMDLIVHGKPIMCYSIHCGQMSVLPFLLEHANLSSDLKVQALREAIRRIDTYSAGVLVHDGVDAVCLSPADLAFASRPSWRYEQASMLLQALEHGARSGLDDDEPLRAALAKPDMIKVRSIFSQLATNPHMEGQLSGIVARY